MVMPTIETNTRKIISRLQRDGWVAEHGAEHDLFRNSKFPGVRITVTRHREQSSGVARSIARLAAWI